jgi:ABC-type polysaccharide/polyol phosphate export permease
MYRVAKSSSGLSDVFASLSSGGLVLLLSWQDIRQRYRRSILGPFWITISNAVLIGSIGLVFGKVFSSGIDLVPSLAIGLTLWTFMYSCILEGCNSFVSAGEIVKQLPIPLFVHVERVVVRNLLIFAHNAVIVPLVLVFFGNAWSWLALLSLAGLCLIVVNLLWIALLVGILCTRYRDLPQIITNALQVAFYVTPIIWTPAFLPGGSLLLDLNPFYHLIEIVRAPLLGNWPSPENWLASALMAVFGWALTLIFFNRYRWRIAYWL